MATSYEAMESTEVSISGDAPAVRSSDDEGIGRAAEKKTSQNLQSHIISISYPNGPTKRRRDDEGKMSAREAQCHTESQTIVTKKRKYLKENAVEEASNKIIKVQNIRERCWLSSA